MNKMRLLSFLGVITSVNLAQPSAHAANVLCSSNHGAHTGGMKGASLTSGNDALS